MMRPIVLLAAACAAAAPLAAQQKIERRIPVASDVSVRITNLEGSTRIIGWDADTLAVTGSVPAGVTFYFGGGGRGAKMGVERDPNAKVAGSVFLEVRVPRGARVWVRSGGGSIEATGLAGEIDAVSVGGTIRLDGALRLVSAEAIDGGVEVTGATGVVRARTGSGRIVLRQLGAGGDITAVTVSGAIEVTEARPAGARLETVSGAVTYAADIERRGRLEVQTHGGDVDLRLQPDTEAEFDLHSLGGPVVFGLGVEKGEPVKPSAPGKPVNRATGGGGAQVTVRSFKGTIRIVPR